MRTYSIWFGWIGLLWISSWAMAQSTQNSETSISEEDPYDELTIRTDKGPLATVRVRPLGFPRGKPPANPGANSMLRVEIIDYPGREFAIPWRKVVGYKNFPNLLVEEAQRLTSSEDYNQAYQIYRRLKLDYDTHPGLDDTISSFLSANARFKIMAGDYAQALAILDELYEIDPKQSQVTDWLQKTTDALINQHIDLGNWNAAKILMARFQGKSSSVFDQYEQRWREKLEDLAEKKLDESQKLMKQGQAAKAIVLVEQVCSILPESQAAKKVYAEYIRQYPLVRIATTAKGALQPQSGTLTWTGRRDRPLYAQELCEFAGYGLDGGIYKSPFGSVVKDPVGGLVTVSLAKRSSKLNAYELSRQLLYPSPDDSWLAVQFRQLISRVSIAEPRKLEVILKRNHVRPEALLQFAPRAGIDSKQSFELSADSEETSVYTRRNSDKSGVQEIQVLPYATTREALLALRQGQVHLVDRLEPAFAAQLLQSNSEGLVIDHYQVPTLHLLIPNLESLQMRNRDFRRSLIYGIDRRKILEADLLGGAQLRGCSMISAAIPIGGASDNSVSYAYDHSIEPREYEPLMSVTLRQMAHIDEEKTLNEGKPDDQTEKLAPFNKLTIAHPNSEISQRTCLAIKQQLRSIGLECKLIVVNPETTDPASVGADLLYVELAIQEPVVDIPKMFDRYVPLQHQMQFFQLAKQRVLEAENWQQVRERFWDLHRMAHNEILIIPLFQLQDYFAYRSSLGKVGHMPVSLFQQVDAWEIGPNLGITSN